MTLLEAREGLTLLVVGTVFASFLIPTSIILFHFSPVAIWRSPLFILNVLAIIMGLTEQSLYVYVIINTTVFGGVPTSLIITIVLMDFLVPICVEGILLVRVISVYPPSSNNRMQNLAIYAPAVAFKSARLANAAYATHDFVGHLPDSVGVIAAAQFVWSTKYVKIEWFLQLFDDIFVSALFIHRLWESITARSDADIHTIYSGSGSSYSWTQRIRTLYYIAISNFIFPILFNVAEIFIIFFDPNFFHGATVVTVNCYVTIIGVLLATIWVQGAKRQNSHHATTTVLASVEFARPHEAADGDEDEWHEDEDGSTRPMPVKEAPVIWLRSGKRVPAKGVGGPTGLHVVVDGAFEEKEKRVSASSSSSGSELGPEAHPNAACHHEKHAHAPAAEGGSVCDPESARVSVSVVHDPISDAV